MISSELFWDWVIRWKRGIVFLVLLTVALIVYLQQTIVFITVDAQNNKDGVVLTLLNEKGIRSGVFHIGSLALIPRDTHRVEATFKTWQTTVKVTPLPWIGIKNIVINIEPDKNALKVSGESLGCNAYNKKTNTLVSYSCGDPTGLSLYKTSSVDGIPWKNEAYLTFPRAYTLSHYKNGVFGISNSSLPQLFYADMDSKTISLPAIPPGMDIKQLNSTTVVTDQVSDTAHFLLVERSSGTIYFATKIGDNSVEYQRYTINKDWYESNNIQCVLKEKTAYCYVGWPSADIHSDDEDEAHEHTRSDGRILTIDFSSSRVEYSSSRVSKEEPVDNIYIDKNNQLYVTMGRNFFSIDNSNTFAKRTIITTSIQDVSGGPSLYYISGNKLYEFNSTTGVTKLRFHSKHLRLSTISQINSEIFVNTFIEGDPGNLLHTYKLVNESNTTPGERIIDKLPIYPNNDQSNIVRMDISGNNIHIVLPSYMMLGNSNQLIPDEKMYTISKQEAINYLSAKVNNLNSYQITFSRAD